MCYWFAKALGALSRNPGVRVGLIATNSIRGGASRAVLERILETATIFMAWSDEKWVLDGADVRVSVLGFGSRTPPPYVLDGAPVARINADLTAGVDLVLARTLKANRNLAFKGVDLSGPFTVPAETARQWLALPNPTGVANRDVLRPYVNGRDVNGRSRDVWVVDFNQRGRDDAARYQVPFAYVDSVVRPERLTKRDQGAREHWWLHHRPRPELRVALAPLRRYVATTRHSKYRFFVWLDARVLPDSALVAVAAEDDFTFGVLHSRLHELWSLALGSSLEDRPRYTNTTCFETFPFPETTVGQRDAVGVAARHLEEIRLHLLSMDAKLTMTQLYGEVHALREVRVEEARAFPLLVAHEVLDAAVADAYGWEWPMTDDEILEQLHALNLARSAGE